MSHSATGGVVAEDTGGEKTEDPTPKKLRDARDEGQVAFSAEVNTAVVLLVGFTGLSLLAPHLWAAFTLLIRRAVSEQLTTEITDGGTVLHLLGASLPVAGVLLAFMLLIFLAVLASSIAQVGFGISWKALIPKWQRVNPLTGLGRIFGMRGLVRTLLSALKLTLVVLVAWKLIAADLPRLTLLHTDLRQRLTLESHQLLVLGLTLAAVLGLIAAVDYTYQRWQHIRDLKMTKQEVKEEFKQSEGDPLVKGKIRQIQRQMAQRRMMQEVPKADVVITNPTHVAVALKYDRDNMAAPEVVAKGYDAMAQKIKEIARENGVPMVENIQLARALAKEVEIGKAVPTKWYQAVAGVLAVVYKIRKAG
jgi:flagellar biosynthetic protein FlhB